MTQPTPESAPATSVAHLGGKYLTFSLRNESYAVDVRKVREIIRMTNITRVPQMPPFVRGVINLRGKIIPVIDLRLRFGMADTPVTDQTCIVVVQILHGTSSRRETGLIVDSVEEVVNLGGQEIEETPNFGTAVDTGYLLGVAKTRGLVKLILDLDIVLAPEEATCPAPALAPS